MVRKVITDEQLYAACDLLRKYGIPNLKCYFMIGQPTETMEDVEAIPDLARRMLERLRVPGPDGHPFGKLTLSVSSFVPKPWTPFQWAPFDEPRDLEAKLEVIKSGARRLQVRVVHENPREAGLQALLARGDRRVADFLEIAARLDGDWRQALREWGTDPSFYTRRERAPGEIMPWDHFDVGVKKAGLLREWQRAGLGEAFLLMAFVVMEMTGFLAWFGIWQLRWKPRQGHSPCSTWTAPSMPSTAPARTAAGPSARGDLDGTVVVCPWHAWRWDVKTGANVNNPAVRMTRFRLGGRWPRLRGLP